MAGNTGRKAKTCEFSRMVRACGYRRRPHIAPQQVRASLLRPLAPGVGAAPSRRNECSEADREPVSLDAAQQPSIEAADKRPPRIPETGIFPLYGKTVSSRNPLMNPRTTAPMKPLAMVKWKGINLPERRPAVLPAFAGAKETAGRGWAQGHGAPSGGNAGGYWQVFEGIISKVSHKPKRRLVVFP